MPEPLTLANASLVLPDTVRRGRLTLSGGRIAELAFGASVPPGATDCGGDFLLPGLVELHTDNLEQHLSPRPDVAWPHAAAIVAHDGEIASAGITTVFDALRAGSIPKGERSAFMPYARRLATEILELRAAGALKVSHFLHLRAELCSETLAEELDEFVAGDRVGIVSLMDHTPGQRQFTDFARYRVYTMGKHGLTAAQFETHVAQLRDIAARKGAGNERAAVAAAARLGAVLASHDDTTPEQVAASARHGVRLAEFPTTRAAAEACREAGLAVIMGAPNLVRGASHSGNVAAGDLAAAGLVDILSSDYVPGALLLGAFRLAALWGDTARALATVTATPAAAVGLGDRGRLAEGLRADVLRVRLVGEQPVVHSAWCAGRQVA